jgi:hypothetical protein
MDSSMEVRQMPIKLFSLDEFPDRIAVSKTGQYVVGGVFFLDFSRKLTFSRELFGRHFSFGFLTGLLVPVVHQGENDGGFVISVHISDPKFKLISKLWKQSYPSPKITLSEFVGGLNIISDFAEQFPEDCQ